METQSFVQKVRERLHPNTYAGRLESSGTPFDLLLARRRSRMSHDLFGVPEFRADVAPRAQIEAARTEIARLFGSLCYRSEIVLHLLVHGPESQWRPHVDALCADRSGFRGVMIQSVHLVDPVTASSYRTISMWGPVKYTRRSAESCTELQGAIQPLFTAAVIEGDLRSRADQPVG